MVVAVLVAAGILMWAGYAWGHHVGRESGQRQGFAEGKRAGMADGKAIALTDLAGVRSAHAAEVARLKQGHDAELQALRREATARKAKRGH